MTRHAKNACSYAVFSHAERARLKYGTQGRRAGAEAQKPFNACELCLHTAEQPVLCSKGHLFCRGCILEFLAQQKELNKIALQKWELQQSSAAAKVESDAAALKQKQLINFEKLDAALLKGNERADNLSAAAAGSSASKGAGAGGAAAAAAAPAGYVRVETNKGGGFVVDRAAVHAHFDPKASREDQAARSSYLPAFWAPSMAPMDVGEAKMTAPPSQQCMCPGGGSGNGNGSHALKLKQLRPVHWHLERTKSEGAVRATSSAGATSTQSASCKPMCFPCKRQLQNQTPMVCVRSCGHVLCRVCVDTLLRGKKHSQQHSVHSSAAAAASSSESKAGDSAAAAAASSSSSSSSSTRLSCLECDELCTEDDLVPIVATGGFAASGNTVTTAKLTPAFRC
jgi:nitric oxide synthase-interacting protein